MTILDQIVEVKKRELASVSARPVSVHDLKTALHTRGGLRDFHGALANPRHGSVALIAEVKKASPSAGLIRPNFDPVQIALDYEAAGASCLSVLTDEQFFQGSLRYLRQIRQAVRLPLLRKDFIIDERQILEAVEWGADAILLIMAILSDTQVRRFSSLAGDAGLAVLVEVHDEPELDRALSSGARLVGVNNRDLRNFKVDLATTEKLATRVHGGRKRHSYTCRCGAPFPLRCPGHPRRRIVDATRGFAGEDAGADRKRRVRRGRGAKSEVRSPKSEVRRVKQSGTRFQGKNVE
jgi:indole-3-glycerol phosphate synthase